MSLFNDVCYVATGFNLPDGCSNEDLPGNTKSDQIEDVKNSVCEKVIFAIDDAEDEVLIHGLDKLTMESEEALKEEILEAIMDKAREKLGL